MTLIEIFGSIDFPRENAGKEMCVEQKCNNVGQLNYGSSSGKIFFDDNNCRSYVQCCKKTAKDPLKSNFDWVFSSLRRLNQQKTK